MSATETYTIPTAYVAPASTNGIPDEFFQARRSAKLVRLVLPKGNCTARVGRIHKGSGRLEMMDGSSLSKEAFSAKKSKLFAGMLFGAIFVWLLVSLIQGPAQLITGVDRESLGYQSQDFSPDFNQAVTRAETALYGKNRGYAIFWHAKRVLVALGAISGVIAAAIAFMKQASPARSQRNLAQSVAVVCGLVAAICPPAISYVDNEADVFLLAGKELMNGIEAAIAQARTNPAAEADVVLELNALVRKHTLEFF